MPQLLFLFYLWFLILLTFYVPTTNFCNLMRSKVSICYVSIVRLLLFIMQCSLIICFSVLNYFKILKYFDIYTTYILIEICLLILHSSSTIYSMWLMFLSILICNI